MDKTKIKPNKKFNYKKNGLFLIKILFLFLVILLNRNIFCIENEQKPQIIFLTGPSCSGKTTLAKALQNHLDEPFLYISLDQIIDMMPSKVNHWCDEPNLLGFGSQHSTDVDGCAISTIQIGPFAAIMRKTFIDICVTLAEKGHFIIIDDVFFQSKDTEFWQEGLKAFKVLWVRLKSPLNILEEREKKRNNHSGCARYQFYHLFHKNFYDLEIDTFLTNIPQSVHLILDSPIKSHLTKSLE